MFGQSVRLQPVPLQSLSELERAQLRHVACHRLQAKNLSWDIRIPKDGPKRRKSLRRKLDSFSKERKECPPKAFGIPLSQVIANDRAHKQKQEAVKESRRDCLEVEATVIEFREQKQKKSLSDRHSLLGSSLEISDAPLSPRFLDNASRVQRRGALSVDSITDLDDNNSRLLEALQLSHPNELESRRLMERNKKLSLNPIYRQVPRVLERCCQHMETYGLHTVGIFRVGSSKKRVRQLREDFDKGLDVYLDDSQSVHDVAALLKEFLRDMPDPLLPRELYSAFITAAALGAPEQLAVLQLLIYMMPPCNGDTLLRLLQFLNTVAQHAGDSCTPDGQKVLGNKMTASNLAMVFGPNLLQREKESITGMEDSGAIISVVQTLLENCQALFMVSADLQNEVLMSLLQTDPDIIDYLLRRKFPSPLGSEVSEEQGEHPLSSDSSTLKGASEEVIHPLSQRRASRSHEDLTRKDCSSSLQQDTRDLTFWGRIAERPKFLPLFSKAQRSPQQSPETPQTGWERLLATHPQNQSPGPSSPGAQSLTAEQCKTHGCRSPSSPVTGVSSSVARTSSTEGSSPRDPDPMIWVHQDSGTPQGEQANLEHRLLGACQSRSTQSHKETMV
ncbi:rho GTPase-activating protein 6-like [Rhinatrema bivittatum]|uniref:rho GTPase-activating protein 6-like n=1 Tax=Rhinatrema bivittatum TaxID=194408 RepID=UPI00112D2547|nr:rho GTPase-activating protein 6-like [Rhinatrema bivittatum]XP_029462982.1 rho GTPase-activating protein 6-like [Rhinatrema bivittatum]